MLGEPVFVYIWTVSVWFIYLGINSDYFGEDGMKCC